MEASSQSSSALGFAVLDIPEDVRLYDGEVAELSADVTSPEGKTLEDVLCVVDLKASGPAPRSPRGENASVVDDDVSHPLLQNLGKMVTRPLENTRGVNKLAKVIRNVESMRFVPKSLCSEKNIGGDFMDPRINNGHVDVVPAA